MDIYTDNPISESDIIFSLDIGTRSVVGIVANFVGDTYEVLDFEQEYHPARAMKDGQIENIEVVSDVCLKVKARLEQRFGSKLKDVHIAAAGRALKTFTASYEGEFPRSNEITKEAILNMEYIAIGTAYESFKEQFGDGKEGLSFYPVGYSVIGYYLDDYPMSSLTGHMGGKIKIDVIAAFLPQNVVQSLYATVQQIGLEVKSLTLEPIAAINLIVPKDIRILNIALVDIGAGTSDIAISKNGSIVAYDMLTTAGDEITEAIMQKYLTDFETAEKIKLSLFDFAKGLEFTDILGNEFSIEAKEVFHSISSVIDELAQAISERIIKCNGGIPVAVFLAGGGSLIPELCQRVAICLNITPERVKVAGKVPLKNVKLCSDKLKSPEFITPIGIGAVTQVYNMKNFFSITVNGNKIMLPTTSENTVTSALLLAGIKPRSLMGISLPSLSFTLNGESHFIKSTPPKAGELRINGQLAALDSVIMQGDVIVAMPAENGKPAIVTIDQLARDKDIPIEDSTITVNGKKCTKDYIICQGDSIQIEHSLPEIHPQDSELVSVLINGKQVDVPRDDQGKVHFVDLLNYVNINSKALTEAPILKINGRNAAYMDIINNGDIAEIVIKASNS